MSVTVFKNPVLGLLGGIGSSCNGDSLEVSVTDISSIEFAVGMMRSIRRSVVSRK